MTGCECVHHHGQPCHRKRAKGRTTCGTCRYYCGPVLDLSDPVVREAQVYGGNDRARQVMLEQERRQ